MPNSPEMRIEFEGTHAWFDAVDDTIDDHQTSSAWHVGTHLDYGFFQEYGTYKMAAQPHVRPGLDATNRQLGRIALQSKDLEDFLEKTAWVGVNEIQARAPVRTGALRDSYSPPTKSRWTD